MPARDGNGPVGLGPKTGWGLGNCDPVSGSVGGPGARNQLYYLTGALGVCGMMLGRYFGQRGKQRLNRNRRLTNKRR